MTEIRGLILDVDGVMTDGRIYMMADGSQARAFHVHDGFAIHWFQRLAGKVAILSGKDVPAVSARARELGIDYVRQGSRNKREDLRSLLDEMDLPGEQVGMLADDVQDLPALRHCGYPMAVANAAEAIKTFAKYVTRRAGGEGAVREAVEHLLAADGRWQQVVAHYEAIAKAD